MVAQSTRNMKCREDYIVEICNSDQLAPRQVTPAETESRNVVKDMGHHEVLVPDTLRWRKQAQKNIRMRGDTTRSFCQFWLCLNWGKASNKKTWCAGLQAVEDQLWRELGLTGFVPLPSREVAGTLKVAFSLGEQSLPPGAHLTLQEGSGKGRGACDAEYQLKGFAQGGTRRAQYGAAIPQGGHPGWAVDVCCLLAGRRPALKHPHFCYSFYQLFAMGVGKAVVGHRFWGRAHSCWALSLCTGNDIHSVVRRGCCLSPCGSKHYWVPGTLTFLQHSQFPTWAQRCLGVVDTSMFSSTTKSSPSSQWLAGTIWALSASRVST